MLPNRDQKPTVNPHLIALLYGIYGLHAFSAVTGLISSAFIVTAFLTGWPSLLAVFLSYIKRDDAEGSYLYSHFEYLIETFWYAFFGLLVCGLLAITIIAIPIAWLLMIIVGVWVLYRLAKGLSRLMDERPVA